MDNYYADMPNNINLEDDEEYRQQQLQQIQEHEAAISDEPSGSPAPSAGSQAPVPASTPAPTGGSDKNMEEAPEEPAAGVEKEEERGMGEKLMGAVNFGRSLLNAPAAGVGNTIFDAIGMVPGLEPAKQWWYKNNKELADQEYGPGTYDHGLVKATRDISAIVIPSMAGGAALTWGGKAVAGASKINALQRMERLGTIAAHIGADVAVTGISSQSIEEDNAAGALEDWLGVNIPWATRDGDSPDVRRAKHIMEAAGLNVGVELLQGLFALRKGVRVVPTSEEALEALGDAPEVVPVAANSVEEVRAAAKAVEKVDPRLAKIQAELSIYDEALEKHTAQAQKQLMGEDFDVADMLDEQSLQLYTEQKAKLEARAAKLSGDPVINAMDDAAEATKQETLEEAGRVLARDPDGVEGYNAFVNKPAEPQAKAVINTDYNPDLAPLDHAIIQGNMGTSFGRARAVVTKGMSDFMQARPGSARHSDLNGLFREDVVTNTQAIVNGKRIPGQQMKQAVDRLVESTFNLGEGGMDNFLKVLDDMKTNTYQGIKVLGEEEFVTASRAFRQMFENMLDPNTMRGSALYTQQMADDIADTARAANIIGEVADTTRQQEIVLERLEVLASEIRINQYVSGRALQYKKLAKSNASPEAIAEWMAEEAGGMGAKVDMARAKAKETVATLKQISKENPELLKPFMQAFDLTNGDVDTIGKMFRWAEEHIGTFHKMIGDRNPEIPSELLAQLNSLRYNNVLSGLATIRAAAGNATNLMLKPVNAFVGSLARGRMDELKRNMAIYGSISETWSRGMKVLKDEWKYALDDYDGAMMRGRADLQIAKSNEIEYMESIADVWRQEGKLGLVAKWNMTKMLKWWNGKAINRYGTTAMYALDGFVKSAMATMTSRASAYDDLMKSGRAQFGNFAEEFAKRERGLYEQMFDKSGLLTDKAAKAASAEISLNGENYWVNGLENLMKQMPVLRTVFMFPRTGLNALELAWSYNPVSSLGGTIGKQRQVFKAATKDQKIAALLAHGIEEYSDEAFEAIKSEYVGRQIMGSSVVFGVGMMAADGRLTGNGPQDGAQRRRMIEAGWQPKSFKIGDQWISYEGLEPFDMIMSLTADAVYQANRVDQKVSEDWMRKIAFAISANITGKTFLSGLQPLTDIISGQNEAAVARFTANFADSMLPMSGARHVFARAVKPQLQDVENDFMSYLQNYNRYIPAADAALEDYIDVYTGQPVNDMSPMEATYNASMPFFKTRGGGEPWREWLLNTGWAGLQKPRINPTTGEPLTAEERQWVNNYVGQNGGLARQIDDMRKRPDGFWDKKMKVYKDELLERGANAPIKEWVVHQELDRIHDAAFKEAWSAWEAKNAVQADIGIFKQATKRAMNVGDEMRAKETIDATETLQNFYKR